MMGGLQARLDGTLGDQSLIEFNSAAAVVAAIALAGKLAQANDLHQAALAIAECVLSSGSATRIVVLADHESELQIAAEGRQTINGPFFPRSGAGISSNGLPIGLLRQSVETGNAASFRDDRASVQTVDRYLANDIAFALCLPLLSRDQLRGLLYLESGSPSLTEPGGTRDFLHLIAEQSAASLDALAQREDAVQSDLLLESLRREIEQLRLGTLRMADPITSILLEAETAQRCMRGNKDARDQTETSLRHIREQSARMVGMLDAARPAAVTRDTTPNLYQAS